MLVTLAGISMLVNELQPENAEFPMLVTPVPIVMLVKPEQLSNAPRGIYPPITVTDFNDDGM